MEVGIVIDLSFNYNNIKCNTIILFLKCFKNITKVQVKGIKESFSSSNTIFVYCLYFKNIKVIQIVGIIKKL